MLQPNSRRRVIMGRRRRRVIRPPRKTLPKFFLCPQCGRDSVKVIMEKGASRAVVICGNCDLKEEFPVRPIDMPVDIYCKFTDKFYTTPKARA